MDKETILNYIIETPGNTNKAVLKGMLDSISGGKNVQSVEEILIFDGELENGTSIIYKEHFITEPISSDSNDFRGITIVTILKYTDVTGKSVETKHICMLNGGVDSSLEGNVAGCVTDSMPYNKPTFLMVNSSTFNNTMNAIKFSSPYMRDTSKPVYATIYQLK